jgi:hypothetical protein
VGGVTFRSSRLILVGLGNLRFVQVNEYTCCAWAGGNFFSSCAIVSVFWLWREIVLGVTYLPYQLCHCIFFLVAVGNSFGLHRSVFWLWREIFLGVTYLPTIPVVPLCQVFGCSGK